jgi:hypothetical protein
MGAGSSTAVGRVFAGDLWISPFKVFQGGIFDEWGEVLLTAAFVALCIIWGIMERQSNLRFWLGLLAVASGVKLVMDGGPIAQTVIDSALALPRYLMHLFR